MTDRGKLPTARGATGASVSIIILVLGFTLASSPEALASGSFGGRWIYAGGHGQRDALRQAIEGVVHQMNAFVRSIARSRLTARVVIAPHLVFAESEEGLLLRHEPLPPRLVRSSASPLRMTNRTGDRVQIDYRSAPNRITEVISFRGSSRTNIYLLVDDGQTLRLDSAIRSNQLPAPVRFVLSYCRG